MIEQTSCAATSEITIGGELMCATVWLLQLKGSWRSVGEDGNEGHRRCGYVRWGYWCRDVSKIYNDFLYEGRKNYLFIFEQ
jgi:hypothetical protein